MTLSAALAVWKSIWKWSSTGRMSEKSIKCIQVSLLPALFQLFQSIPSRDERSSRQEALERLCQRGPSCDINDACDTRQPLRLSKIQSECKVDLVAKRLDAFPIEKARTAMYLDRLEQSEQKSLVERCERYSVTVEMSMCDAARLPAVARVAGYATMMHALRGHRHTVRQSLAMCHLLSDTSTR